MVETLLAFTLVWTNPSTNAGMLYIPVEERESPGDSLRVDCTLPPSGSMSDLDSVRVFVNPSTGGGYRYVASKGVRGREGLGDTLSLTLPFPGAHIYVLTVDRSGLTSCVSNEIYVGSVTAVEVPQENPVVKTLFFDVHGRRVVGRMANGVYWMREFFRSGHVQTRKVVIVR